MSPSRKPDTVKVGDRGELVESLFASASSVVAGMRLGVTCRFVLGSWSPSWTVPSDQLECGGVIDDRYIAVGDGERGGTRSLEDGRILWTAPTRCGAFAGSGYAELQTDTSVELRAPDTGRLLSAVAVPGGVINPGSRCGDTWIFTSRGVAKAVRLDGTKVWERSLVDDLASLGHVQAGLAALSVVPGEGDLFIAVYGNAVFGCAVGTGAIKWVVPVSVPYYEPNVDGNRVCVLCDDRFVVIDAVSGIVKVDRRFPGVRGLSQCRPGCIRENRIAFPHESGVLAVFDIETGELASVHDGRALLWKAVDAGGQLVVATGQGTLQVFDESIWGG